MEGGVLSVIISSSFEKQYTYFSRFLENIQVSSASIFWVLILNISTLVDTRLRVGSSQNGTVR